MNFTLSDASLLKLKELKSNMKSISELDKKYKERILNHLKTYHFKSFDEMIEYLKTGNRIKPDTSIQKSDIDFITYDNETDIIDIWRKTEDGNYKVEPLTIDMFHSKYFFTTLEDSNGYLQKWHKNID